MIASVRPNDYTASRLALTPGTRLGVYEVTAQIGVGGMGEVYRATDTTLGRQVALKILPEAVASDPERIARFEREAKTLAALNHPNVAAIYGVEKSSGAFTLVMELVEGEDLLHRIARGAIPADEALPIAKQIAEALEAAHEQGIIHRDLKPANIKVRPDGTVKVLDFGLAKALDQSPASSPRTPAHALSMSPTITSPAMTAMGMILGTAAYMAPEQVKGNSVDKRADIWAFGVLLYEMLTGHRAFTGDDVSDVLVAVLSKDVNLSALPAGTPPRLLALVRDCLVRDPQQRLRDIGDARIVLARIIAGAPEAAAGSAAPSGVVPASSRVLPWALASVLATAAAAMLILWAPWRVEKPVDRPLVRLDVDLGADVALPSAANTWGTIAISPDATRLAYISGTPPRLFIRRLDQPKAAELPGTFGVMYQPFFSLDGQWVGFSASTRIAKISVEGGAVVPLGEVSSFGNASWNDDSLFVGEPFGRGLLRFPADGGSPTIVVPANDGAMIVPQPLPGGKAILFAACATGGSGADGCNVEALTLADGRRKILAYGGHSPHYVPSSNGLGYLIYLNKATLFAIPFDPVTLETSGTAVPILNDVAFHPLTGAGLFDVAQTGTLIYRQVRAAGAGTATVEWVDSAGKKERLQARPDNYQHLAISPDGKRILLIAPEGANQDIWVYDPQRDAMTRLTFGGINYAARWSPDGQYIVYLNFEQGLFQARADGASPPHALMAGKSPRIPWSFTPDGKRLAYTEMAPRARIWTVPLDSQAGQLKAGTPEQFLKSNFRDNGPSFSPDGRWLAYYSNESGRAEVYVRAFPPPSSGQGGKWQVSNNGGAEPHWSRTGHELIYLLGDQLMAVSYSVNGDAFVADTPRVWISALGGADTSGATWDLAPDGKRIAVLVPQVPARSPQPEHEIVMLQNFADELRRRVPVGR